MDEYHVLKKICDKRKSVREFREKKVSPHLIEKIKDLAYTSPYVSGRKNWELMIVSNKSEIKNIAECVRNKVLEFSDKIKNDFKQEFLEYSKNFSSFENAPVLIIPAFRASSVLSTMIINEVEAIKQWERDNYVKSISCVCMVVLLAAESLALGGCFMTGPLIAEKEINDIIRLKPGRIIAAIIPVGYPKRKAI